MNPENQQKLDELYEFMQMLKSSTTIPQDVDGAFRERLSNELSLPDGMEDAPLATVTDPTGGSTIDGEARAVINTIIDRLQDLGLIS